LEPSRGRTGPLPVAPVRAGGQALLVGLMVVAFLILVLARTIAPAQSPASTPSAPAVVAASPVVDASPSPQAATPGITASPGPAAPSATPPTSTAAPSPTKSPVSPTATRYKVRSGDTLGGIAARFGTTAKAIAAANNIKDAALIHVGQVLIIP
jgi:LysM repeat protein